MSKGGYGAKIILSRKGCDSSAGGCASPIFPDDRIASLPIPDECGPSTYRDIASSLSEFSTIGDLLDALGRPLANRHAHLDPDLKALSRPRARGWRPTFGQDEAAEGHLRNNGITIGDLFLFFGWFQDVRSHAGRPSSRSEWTRHIRDFRVAPSRPDSPPRRRRNRTGMDERTSTSLRQPIDEQYAVHCIRPADIVRRFDIISRGRGFRSTSRTASANSLRRKTQEFVVCSSVVHGRRSVANISWRPTALGTQGRARAAPHRRTWPGIHPRHDPAPQGCKLGKRNRTSGLIHRDGRSRSISRSGTLCKSAFSWRKTRPSTSSG